MYIVGHWFEKYTIFISVICYRASFLLTADNSFVINKARNNLKTMTPSHELEMLVESFWNVLFKKYVRKGETWDKFFC